MSFISLHYHSDHMTVSSNHVICRSMFPLINTSGQGKIYSLNLPVLCQAWLGTYSMKMLAVLVCEPSDD